MEKRIQSRKMTILFYVIGIIAAIAIVYYLNSVYNPPQPEVFMNYNYTTQQGAGYINDTLPYAIKVYSLYCTLPNGYKLEFNEPNNVIVAQGSNTFVSINSAVSSYKLDSSCVGWKVYYEQWLGPIAVSNSPIIAPTNITIIIHKNQTTNS